MYFVLFVVEIVETFPPDALDVHWCVERICGSKDYFPYLMWMHTGKEKTPYTSK